MPEEQPIPPADPADEAAARIREALAADPPDLNAALDALPDRDLLAEARAQAAAEPPDFEAVRRAIEVAIFARPVEAAKPVEHWHAAATPDPVLSLADGGGGKAALLSVGEVAVLASAGGLGKSTLTVGVAAAAAGGGGGKAFGLRVAPGPVVLAGFEDAPARIANRLRWYAPWPPDKPTPPAAWSNLHLLPRPRPLWQADDDGGSCPGPDWRRYWRTVREADAVLAIVDPASVALADVDTNQTGPVRAFLDAMTAEAEAAGCGVLIVAHDTKAARNEARAGGDPGAGAVAGSAAWYDAARGVLYVRRERDGLTLECLKSSYGPDGWASRLRLRQPTKNQGFRGPDPEPERVFDRDELAAWRKGDSDTSAKTDRDRV